MGARGVAGNWLNLEPVLLPALLLGIDFIAGVIVYRALPEDWIYISLAVFIWLLRRAWLLGNNAIPVLLTIPGEDRPAARKVSEAGRARALRTVRIAFMWAILTHCCLVLPLEILEADRIVDG